MTALRPYQTELVAAVRDALSKRNRRVLLQAPTGSGKTVLTAHMIAEAASRGLSTWFCVHRRELLDQSSDTLTRFGVRHGRIAAGHSYHPERNRVHVASIQTLARRLGNLRPPNLLIIDEAHHATAATYRAVLDHAPTSWIIGLSATPERMDGRGLDDLFGHLVPGPSVRALIDAGFLAPYRIIAPPAPLDLVGVHTRGGDWQRGELEEAVQRRVILGDAVEHYRKHVHPRTCLVYCVSRSHARAVENAYLLAGIHARYCAGDTPDAERVATIEGFRSGVPRVLVSVDLFGEGLDVPGLQAVQLLRPTQSLALHLQQVGRALRPDGTGEPKVILDHVGNTWLHGLPDDERRWSLAGRPRRSTERDGPALRHCTACHAIYEGNVCPLCGAAPANDGRKAIETVEGSLEELDLEAIRANRKREEAKADTLESLIELGRARGYKPGWAVYRWHARTGEPIHAVQARARALGSHVYATARP